MDEITLVDYDPLWPEQSAAEAARIQGALGDSVVVIEHFGSTAIPGLAAKPIIDLTGRGVVSHGSADAIGSGAGSARLCVLADGPGP